MDLAALKAELTADPERIGYLPHSPQNDITNCELITAGGRETDRLQLTADMIASSVDHTEYAALSGSNRGYLELLVMAGSVTVTPQVRTAMADIFPRNSVTRSNLITALKTQGSRADQLRLGRVTPSDIARARDV